MSPRTRKDPADEIEEGIKRAGSIGALEQMAGIETTIDARFAFWTAYSSIRPAGASLDAGVAELKRRIRAQAALLPPHAASS